MPAKAQTYLLQFRDLEEETIIALKIAYLEGQIEATASAERKNMLQAKLLKLLK